MLRAILAAAAVPIIVSSAGAQSLSAMALGDKAPDEGDVEKTAKIKAAIIAVLKGSNDYCERAYGQSDDKVKGPVDIFGQHHAILRADRERVARRRTLRPHRDVHAAQEAGSAVEPAAAAR